MYVRTKNKITMQDRNLCLRAVDTFHRCFKSFCGFFKISSNVPPLSLDFIPGKSAPTAKSGLRCINISNYSM